MRPEELSIGGAEGPDEEPAEGKGAPTMGVPSLAAASAWALTACWAAWAVLRLTGAERIPGLSTVLVPLVAFVPYVAATAIVPVGYALLLRRWAPAAAAAVVALALVLFVVPRAVPWGGGATPRGPVLRVLTVNMLYGQADPGAVVDLVRRTGTDLLSVQELTPDAVDALDAAGLTRLLPHSVLTPFPQAAGSGLYARYRLRPLGEVGGAARARTGFRMPRAVMELPGGTVVDAVAVHPVAPTSRIRVRRWDRDLRALPEPSRPAGRLSAGGAAGVPVSAPPYGPSARRSRPAAPVRVLVGDFNATLDHARLRALLDAGYRDAAATTGDGLVPTFGGSPSRPPITIDHVLVDARAGVRKVSVHPIPGSDHRAVAAELRLP